MCEQCQNLITRKYFYSPQDYLDCLVDLQSLLETGDFELIEATCAFDSVRNDDGVWIADHIQHRLRCKQCGDTFLCFADPYHGGGGFYKER